MRTAIIFCTLLLSACASPYRDYYDQVSPTKYPPTQNIAVFEYQNVDIQNIYQMLFSDYLVIGKSGFNGIYVGAASGIGFAKSIGADVFISTSQFKETRTSFQTMTLPTVNTSLVSGYTGKGSFYGTATSYGTSTTTVASSENSYDQYGLFLRNVNHVQPLWERTRADYKETGTNDLCGLWYNENYEIQIIKSGEQMVAFVITDLKGTNNWKPDELKAIFNPESGNGVYLMGDKAPQPATIKLNKFGHLEVNLITQKEYFSFAKK